MAARTFGQVWCSIWEDPDFIGLTAGAQRTYLMLTTQDNIQACGLLPLTLRRWARTCPEKHLDVWLVELCDAGFVVLDEDTEELLVRTFTKYDRGHEHAVRRKAVISSARSIKSPLLRSTSVDELGKLGVSIATPEPPQGQSSATPEPVESQRFSYYVSGEQWEPGTENLEKGDAAADAADDPSSPFCPPHQPNGPDGKPCPRCADRAKALKHAASVAPVIQAAEKTRRRGLIDDCTRCNETGFIEGLNGELLGKCSHSDVLASRRSA